ncbi:MAG: LptF/LptG family permease [Sphaerochaetaceae bacterium]
MRGDRVSKSTILHSYILKGFINSLIVAFIFFFFIFFINQLLLFAQKVLIKSVSFNAVVRLIALSIPQILLYTIPFSTLSASAMLIGELAEKNEILAIRTLGIPLRKAFSVIVISSIILAALTFVVADLLLPYSSYRFKELYSELMEQVPTIELESYAVKRVGDKVLVTQEVKDNEIDSLLIFDTTQKGEIISSTKGKLNLLDLDSYLYAINLENPKVLSLDQKNKQNWEIGTADQMLYYIDLKSELSQMQDLSPSQLSSRDLLKAIELRKADLAKSEQTRLEKIEKLTIELQQEENRERIKLLEEDIAYLKKERPINFYLQYYRAELHKKIALSFSSFFLVFITFPLALLKVKHGRLFGFGLSLVVASGYWFLLFFAQLQILEFPYNPGFLMWGPNIVVVLIAILALLPSRRI